MRSRACAAPTDSPSSMSPGPTCIVIARKGSPVIIGIGDREMFVASDVAASLVRHTRQVVHLDDGEVAVLDTRGFRTMTMDARPISKAPATVEWEDDAYERDGHAHYMYKEILDQPESVLRTLGGRLDHQFHTAHLGGLNLDAGELLDVKRVKLLGCGSAPTTPGSRARTSSSRSLAFPQRQSRRRSSGTATRSSSAIRSTWWSASRARPSIP